MSTPSGALPEPASVSATVQALSRLLSLPAGWDSYDSPQISPACVAAANGLARDLLSDGVPAPAVVPTSAGGVQLEWHTRGIDLEIEVHEDGRVSACFADQRTGAAWQLDEVSGVGPLRDALREMAAR